jgi:tripartite-type tricarboxylate transporter receptor subunit TctC
VPTIGETGVPGYAVLNWYALVAPKGLPPTITEQLNATLHAALRDEEVVRKLAAQGIEPLPSTPEAATAFFAAETAKWGALVQAAKISLD